jgi:hypothetical protein
MPEPDTARVRFLFGCPAPLIRWLVALQA